MGLFHPLAFQMVDCTRRRPYTKAQAGI